MIKKILIINGTQRTLVVEGQESLAEVLRDRLLLTGCKIGCGEGHCGACNVIVDGKVTRSCITKIAKVPDYAKIETIEGIGTLEDLHPLQAAWIAHGCAQCGFCSPGFIMNVLAMMREYEEKAEKSGRASDAVPGVEEIKEYLAGNLCRCTGYMGQLRAIQNYMAEKKMTGENVPEKKEVRA